MRRLSDAAHEALGNLVLFEIAANEDEPAHAPLLWLPIALEITVDQHMDPLKDETLRLTFEGENALGAQD